MSVAVPPGFKLCIVARSGLADKGIVVTNAPAQIDSDYRNEIEVIVANHGREIVPISHGERVAQMYIEPVYKIEWEVVDQLDATERKGGFGHTGMT